MSEQQVNHPTAPTNGTTSGPSLDVALRLAPQLHAGVARVVRGKNDVISLSLAAVLSGGHVLIEDVPGTGKTLLAKSLARVMGGTFGRVQCTPDLLPADITGTSVFRPDNNNWEFRPGPIFANVVLVDEINRASPRTQAALLEPMEERHVTVDGSTWSLPEQFTVIATQNPLSQIGTFPLPESQLDRFSIVVSVGLPDRDSEREIIAGQVGVDQLDRVQAVTTPEELQSARAGVATVHVSDEIYQYVLSLAHATRQPTNFTAGVSPRASRSLVRLAQGFAVTEGRDFVTPDDIQATVIAAFAHRVLVAGRANPLEARERLAWLLTQVVPPRG